MYNRNQLTGFVFASLGAMAYGLNPLFAVPLFKAGMNVNSVLLFRFGIGALLVLLLMASRKQLPKISLKALPFNVLNGVLMSLSSLFLYTSFLLMDVGLASTLLFVYPIMVAVIMSLCFHERAGWSTIISIALALLGVAALNGIGGAQTAGSGMPMKGLIFVMLSSLAYALYIVMVRVTPLRNVPSDTQTFWSLCFGLPTFTIATMVGHSFVMPPTLTACAIVACMAFFPTLLALVFTALAIKKVGATAAAIIGALEPMTAVAVGIIAFHEKFTFSLAVGMALILAAVIIVIAKPSANTQQ